MLVSTTFHVDTTEVPDDFDSVFRAAFADKQESFTYKGATFNINYNPGPSFVTMSVEAMPKQVPKVFGKRKGLWFREVTIRAIISNPDILLPKPGSYARALTDSEGRPSGILAFADPEGENEYNIPMIIVCGDELESVVEYYHELMTGALEPRSPLPNTRP